jgi:hypothetical protein
MRESLTGLEPEQRWEAEEQPPFATQPDATEHQAGDRVRLAAMDREEVSRGRPDGEVPLLAFPTPSSSESRPTTHLGVASSA